MSQGIELPCGCITGYYYCGKHDIYQKKDTINDPRWNGQWTNEIIIPILTARREEEKKKNASIR